MASSPANIARILSHSRLFYAMSPASLIDLQSHGYVEEWTPNQRYRLPANELRIILEGDIHIPADGNETENVLGRGNFVGEVGVLDLVLGQELDRFEARSAGGCTCLVLLPHEINAWLKRHPKLEAPFFRHLSQELLNRRIGAEIEPARRNGRRAG